MTKNLQGLDTPLGVVLVYIRQIIDMSFFYQASLRQPTF